MNKWKAPLRFGAVFFLVRSLGVPSPYWSRLFPLQYIVQSSNYLLPCTNHPCPSLRSGLPPPWEGWESVQLNFKRTNYGIPLPVKEGWIAAGETGWFKLHLCKLAISTFFIPPFPQSPIPHSHSHSHSPYSTFATFAPFFKQKKI